jgi:hypothetical protein
MQLDGKASLDTKCVLRPACCIDRYIVRAGAQP